MFLCEVLENHFIDLNKLSFHSLIEDILGCLKTKTITLNENLKQLIEQKYQIINKSVLNEKDKYLVMLDVLKLFVMERFGESELIEMLCEMDSNYQFQELYRNLLDAIEFIPPTIRTEFNDFADPPTRSCFTSKPQSERKNILDDPIQLKEKVIWRPKDENRYHPKEFYLSKPMKNNFINFPENLLGMDVSECNDELINYFMEMENYKDDLLNSDNMAVDINKINDNLDNDVEMDFDFDQKWNNQLSLNISNSNEIELKDTKDNESTHFKQELLNTSNSNKTDLIQNNTINSNSLGQEFSKCSEANQEESNEIAYNWNFEITPDLINASSFNYINFNNSKKSKLDKME